MAKFLLSDSCVRPTKNPAFPFPTPSKSQPMVCEAPVSTVQEISSPVSLLVVRQKRLIDNPSFSPLIFIVIIIFHDMGL